MRTTIEVKTIATATAYSCDSYHSQAEASPIDGPPVHWYAVRRITPSWTSSPEDRDFCSHACLSAYFHQPKNRQ